MTRSVRQGRPAPRALSLAVLLAVPLSADPAAAHPVTASQLSAAPYGRMPIRSNRPEWEIYNGYRPGGSPSSGVLGYAGGWGPVLPEGETAAKGRFGRR